MIKVILVNDTKLSHINFTAPTEKNTPVLSNKQSKIVNFINKRISKGILTTTADLEQFVNSKKDKKTAARKLASRLCATGLIESHEGTLIPKGHKEYLKNLNIKFLKKIKSKREKNKIFKSKQQFIEQIKPFITENKWSFPSTQLTAQFKINHIFQQFTQLNLYKIDNNCLVIPLIFKDKSLFPNQITLYIYSHDKVIIKIGDKSNLIQANAAIICSALSISHNYLISTSQFWDLGLDIPCYSNWIISIPYIYSNTLYDYTKLNGKIRDND